MNSTEPVAARSLNVGRGNSSAAERRLLIVTESLGVGGTESHLVRILPRLAASGLKVAVFCLAERGEQADVLEAHAVEVLAASPKGTLERGHHHHPVLVARAAARLFWSIRRWNPHIAHFYLPGPYLVGAPVAVATRVPVKIMSRRSLSDYQQSWPAVTRIERVLHGAMDALVGNSRAVVAQLNSECAAESKIRLIYNGIDIVKPPNRCSARRMLGLDDHELIGLVVANLIPYKGHQDLLRGLGQVARQLPSPWRVLLVGRDEGLRPKLECLARSEGIAHNVQFLGQRSDVSSLMAAADFGLLTSHEEGFSNVVIEAMASGLAMVVTSVGGNLDAVIEERTGLLVPPRDPTAIGEAVLRLARDPNLRKTLGEAGRIRVEREFSIDRCAQAHRELYQALLAKRSID